VLDSSVLFAAHIARAVVSSELLEEVLLKHEFVISDFILAELEPKLREKFEFPASEIRQVMVFQRAAAMAVVPAELPESACRDPSDVPVLGTAVAGHADFLVNVDRDLLALEMFQGIAILRPWEFWRQLEARS
jgi:putative PIN family toxin of toxin-antitoxin system